MLSDYLRGFARRIFRRAPFLRRMVPLRRSKPSIIYASYAEAAAACAGSYRDDMLNRFRYERAALNLDNRDRGGGLPSGYRLLEDAARNFGGRPLIVDFGGGCGEYGLALQAAVACDYVVVENPTLAGLCSGDSRFSWADFVSEPPARADIFFTSGTLQYLPDPYTVLEAAFSTSAAAVILARNSFADQRTFHVQSSRLRDNGGGLHLPPGYDLDGRVCYPHGTIRLDDVIEIAGRWGWIVARSEGEESGAKGEGAFGRNVVFQKSRN